MTGDAGLTEQMRIRKAKRDRLLDAAPQRVPYPISVPRDHGLAQVRVDYEHLTAGQETQDVVSVAGRVVFIRVAGKLCFATLQDGDGTRLQVMLSLAEVGEKALAEFKDDVDLGDFISVTGRVISSKRGELSVLAGSWQLAAKALRPLPVLHRDLSEEARVRQRYADLIVRPAARDMVRTRAAVVSSVRATLHEHDFIEVETPMLQTLHGGATARPFTTRSNALGIDLFLRIAPELFLKRALVGGVERVFEINRNFRNEGVDSTHSPEFAMLEFYQAYADYNDVAELTRAIVQNAAIALTGSTTVTLADGSECDVGGQWPRIALYESLSEAVGEEITPETPTQDLSDLAGSFGLDVDQARATSGKLVEEMWEATVQPSLHAPTFVVDFPVDTSPLVKAHRSVPGVVEKWDLYVRGLELATGYSELNDPVVQRQRLVEQARLAASGDEEAPAVVDEDFLRAMEYGMPPAGGVGMGIDRLLMTLTGLGIRETILFPLVRPR
ncbi:MAG: lysine--tRNA ligase [Micrococcales bacterium]|nr:MAG: lysine--tRNA ligase [Micrococcales bacterium]